MENKISKISALLRELIGTNNLLIISKCKSDEEKRCYTIFQNRDALRNELTWTHYRLLIRVESRGNSRWK